MINLLCLRLVMLLNGLQEKSGSPWAGVTGRSEAKEGGGTERPSLRGSFAILMVKI